MLSIVSEGARNLAKIGAHRPIHVIIVTALLASISYLSLVDEYMPESFRVNSTISYYNAGKRLKSNDWEFISDTSSYKDADRWLIVPLKFKSPEKCSLPALEDTFNGRSLNERILLSRPEDLDSKLGSISKINYDGVSWTARSSNKAYKYSIYLRQGLNRLTSLIRGAERFDIGIITSAYIAMWYTLLKVFFDMKKAGSNFWLAFSTLTSSMFAFLFALVVSTKILNTKVSLISLSEGIPFLVAVVGFKHKVSIATVVLGSSASNSDVRSLVPATIAAHTVSIFRDYLAVVGALVACSLYAPLLEGLKNFCILGVLILTFDLILIYTFLSAILALKIEINRARRTEDLKTVLEEEGVSSSVAQTVAVETSSLEYHNDQSAFSFKSTTIFSVKIIIVAAFISFHVFYLGSSWLYDPRSSIHSTPTLSKAISKHIKVGSAGTVVTILPEITYTPPSLLYQLEDYIFAILEKVSLAIKDNLISKFLLFAFAVSISTNAYFLNYTRLQMITNRKLLNKEISITEHKAPAQKPMYVQPESLPNSPVEHSVENFESNGSGGHLEDSSSVLPLVDCVRMLEDGNVKLLNNREISSLVVSGKLPMYSLEKQLGDKTRAVAVRRRAIGKLANVAALDTESLPYRHYDYERVFGACCENVIGYMPIPVGIAGPIIIDQKPYHIPMATTEGCLVASAMRGCKAINLGGGVQTVLTGDGMTRGPCVSFSSLARAGACKLWLDSEEGSKKVKTAFNSTSRFARLQNIQTTMAGTLLFIRFKTTTGDAMGMNMISKGVEHALKYMQEECEWSDMEVISVSGNYCIDKKPAAINWIEGRGKSVVAEAIIPADAVRKVLKSDVDALVKLNISKNLVGSAMAGSVGGFNAQAANLVTAVYLACGQDPAQNVESSNCITLMEKDGDDLRISVSMPSIEVGTIGGGTILEPQGAMLELLGVRGPHPTSPGENSRQLARIIASIVLAAELSLCSALAAGHLVQSHMQHNRKTVSAGTNGGITHKKNGSADLRRLKEGSKTCIRS